MGFPNNVRDKVLVKCKRHCCLCGKYVGINMELHHIRQKADGGDDTEDNCIPLCFDCHAKVKSYNPHHPKGLKYSERELKQRRNEVYEAVKNKLICGYLDADINKAVKLLENYYKQIEEICEIDPCSEQVDISLIDCASEMIRKLKSFAFVFSNEEAEDKKNILVEAIEDWVIIMQNEKYFHVNGNGFLCFNSESVNCYREKMYSIRQKIYDCYHFFRQLH